MSDGFTKTEIALLEALERERALLRQRDVVNGIVIHEMANAVTVVAGTVDLLQMSEPRSPTHQFALMQLRSGVRAMNDMIRGLRVLLEEKGEPPVFARDDLPAFVQGVVTDPVLVAENAGRRVTLHTRGIDNHPAFCPTLLRHALGNLVRNALSYSPAESMVSIAIGGRGNRWWIHIMNRGPKISAATAERLFEPGKKSAQGGMGFGLHITRTCVLRMGGQIVFGSTKKATVFSLLLPHREATPESTQPAAATSALHGAAPANSAGAQRLVFLPHSNPAA